MIRDLPEGQTQHFKHAALLNTLCDMQQSLAYAARKPVLVEAEIAISAADIEIANLTRQRDELLATVNKYADVYLRDERDNSNLCMDKKHHEDICALFDAIAAATESAPPASPVAAVSPRPAAEIEQACADQNVACTDH